MERIRVQNPGLEKFLQAEEGNTLCADCNAKKPRWASVSLGIFICTNCAGIHRKLGVHISFVQSCTIDKWKPEWITKFSKMGNSVAKMYYEHGITEEVIASLPVELQQVLLHGEDLKLTSGDSMSVEDAAKLEDWIRRKYERKEFCLHAYGGTSCSIIVPPEPKVLVQQGKDPRSEYDSFLELYYGVPPPAAAGGTASGTQGTGRSGAASSSSTGLNNGGNSGGATAAQMNFQRSTSRETRGGEEPASSSSSRRQRERGTTGAGAAAGSGRNQEDAGSFWNNAAGFSDHFEHGGVGEQMPAPSREQGTRRRKKKSSAYNSANEESNGEHNFMPPSAGSFFGNTFPGAGMRTATTAAPAPAPASFAEPAGAFPAPPQTGNGPGGRPAEMYNWQRDPTATYNSYSTSRNPPVDHLPGRARMGSGGPGPAATGSFSPQEVGGPAPLSPQWHDWQQEQAVAAHRNMMMTQHQHRVQAGGMTNPAGVWSSATVQQIQQNQSVAPLPNVDLAQLAAIFGLSGCEPGDELAGNGGKQARKKSSRPHEQLTVLQAEEHQTAGLRKQHEWQLMIDEHYPEHARRQAERGARKRHALAAVTRLFSEKTAVAELFDPANLILPFGLNIHAKRFEFDSGMRMSTDYDRSKGSGCKMNGGKRMRMPVSTASVGVQTGEDLLLHYIQQKLLRESQRLLEAKMRAIGAGGGGGMGSGFGFSAAEGNRNVGSLHMGAGTGMAPGGGPATYIAPP
eukprot:g420.t1